MTETVPAPALSFQQLSVTFATDAGTVRAVDEVTFDVKPGEVLAVVGESGIGEVGVVARGHRPAARHRAGDRHRAPG